MVPGSGWKILDWCPQSLCWCIICQKHLLCDFTVASDLYKFEGVCLGKKQKFPATEVETETELTLYFRGHQAEKSMGKSRSTIIPIMTKWHKGSEYSDLELTSGRNQSNQNHSFPGFLVKFTWRFIKLNGYNKHKCRSLHSFCSLK